MQKAKKIIYMIIGTLMCIMLILNAQTSANAAKGAVERCLGVMIPSLFVFMAAAEILVRSGAVKYLSLPFYPIAKYILKMPYELFSVFIIANTAGFPVGAAMLKELVDSGKISKKTASVMSCYCYCGGPSFAVGVIGMYIYGSRNVGLIVWGSAAAANILLAALLNRIFDLQYRDVKSIKNDESILIASVQSAGRNMLMICAMIIVFAVMIADVGEYIKGIDGNARVLISSVFEISGITGLETHKISLIPLISAIFSFGGVCVVLQTVIAGGKRFEALPFIVTRIPAFLITFLLSGVLSRVLLSDADECFAKSENVIVNFNNFIPSICLILMIFLLLFKKGVAFSKDI